MQPTFDAPTRVAVIGGGPGGMTAALLLARAGHRVVLFEKGRELGGLWATDLDGDGFYLGENSCKVFQPTYVTAPVLLRMLGTTWDVHFTRRHDLTRDWLVPFVRACSIGDMARLGGAFLLHAAGLRTYRGVSVAEFLATQNISESCQAWMRATALGGITGTLRMTMWELFHRLGSNLGEVALHADGPLFWNARPPNAPGGFVARWRDALQREGVEMRTACGINAVRRHGVGSREGLVVETATGERERVDAVFLALPPPALSRLLVASDRDLAEGFGHDLDGLKTVLAESVYQHLGMTWHFDRTFTKDLPLGGHNVRRGWHPILVQHDQYRAHLRPPAVTVVVGSVSLDANLAHQRLASLARDHTHDEVAHILWDDERRVDPTLPEPIACHVYGISSATQVVRHGTLPVRSRNAALYLASNLNGLAPYFTASLESAIQAGEAAAAAFDPSIERLTVAASTRPRDARDAPEAGAITPGRVAPEIVT